MSKNVYFTYFEDFEQHNYTLQNEIIKYTHIINDDVVMVQATNSTRVNLYKSYVQIASCITSYARIYLHKFKIKYQKNLFYSDTDSLFLDIKMDDCDVDSNNLGFFKLVSKCQEGIFIKSKMYYLKLENDEEIKKGAGFDSSKLSYEDYKYLLYNDNVFIDLKDNKLNKKHFLLNTSNKILNDIKIDSKNKRRKKIYGDQINTYPININNEIDIEKKYKIENN